MGVSKSYSKLLLVDEKLYETKRWFAFFVYQCEHLNTT